MACTYGPVPSRRLGLSLGVDILPYKTCTLDCIYCQLGRTSNLAVERKPFFPREEILAEVITVASETNPAYVTFSGSGEPTLNSDIGWLIRRFKEKINCKVAVLTNSSLLWMPNVRDDIRPADLVVPSLDAATEEVWKKLNRPHPDLDFSKVIEGLIDFSNEYAGQLWVEILMVKGMNDSAEHVKALNRILARMRFDKVQLNTVVRPPSEESALALSYEELRAISKELSVNTEIIAPYRKKGKQVSAHGDRERILAAIARRPMTVKQIEQSLGIPPERSKPALEALVAKSKAKPSIHEEETFYEAVR